MFICYIYRHLCFDNVYMPIKNLNLNKKVVEISIVSREWNSPSSCIFPCGLHATPHVYIQ